MRHQSCRRTVQAADSQNELSTNESSCQELYDAVFMYPARGVLGSPFDIAL